MKINLGSGKDIKHSYTNVDYVKHEGVDIVHDLEVYPYPFKTGSADEILMSHVLEHLVYPLKALIECHRILKPRGLLTISVPHKNHPSAYSLDHKKLYNENSLTIVEALNLFDIISIKINRSHKIGRKKEVVWTFRNRSGEVIRLGK